MLNLFKTKRDLNERKPLPVGMIEFEEWSDRIIAGTLLSADPKGMKFALASMLMHLGPTESFKEDIYFIHSLRKAAVNQIAHAKLTAIKEEFAAQSQATKDLIIPNKQPLKVVAEQATQASEVTPTTGVTTGETKVLGN